MFDGAFAYWREPPISFAVSVCPSACISMVLTWCIFVTFDNGRIYMTVCRENLALLKMKQTTGLLRNKVVLLPASCNCHCGMRCHAKLAQQYVTSRRSRDCGNTVLCAVRSVSVVSSVAKMIHQKRLGQGQVTHV
jgi:hypothetical protein